MIPSVPFGQSLINPKQIVYFHRVLEPVIEKGHRIVCNAEIEVLSMNVMSIRDNVLNWIYENGLQESLDYTANHDCASMTGNEKYEFTKFLMALHTIRTYMEIAIVSNINFSGLIFTFFISL